MRAKTRQVELNGKKHYVNFGLLMLRNFCRSTGIDLKEIDAKLASGGLDIAIEFAHQSLIAGAKAEKQKKVDVSEEDLLFLFDEDEKLFEKIMTAFADTLPKDEDEGNQKGVIQTP